MLDAPTESSKQPPRAHVNTSGTHLTSWKKSKRGWISHLAAEGRSREILSDNEIVTPFLILD